MRPIRAEVEALIGVAQLHPDLVQVVDDGFTVADGAVFFPRGSGPAPIGPSWQNRSGEAGVHRGWRARCTRPALPARWTGRADG